MSTPPNDPNRVRGILEDASRSAAAGVPRIQVLNERNRNMAVEVASQRDTVASLRSQLRGLNRRNTDLAAENEVLRHRLRIQLRMLDEYRAQGFRRDGFTPLHVAIKRATEGVKAAIEGTE